MRQQGAGAGTGVSHAARRPICDAVLIGFVAGYADQGVHGAARRGRWCWKWGMRPFPKSMETQDTEPDGGLDMHVRYKSPSLSRLRSAGAKLVFGASG